MPKTKSGKNHYKHSYIHRDRGSSVAAWRAWFVALSAGKAKKILMITKEEDPGKSATLPGSVCGVLKSLTTPGAFKKHNARQAASWREQPSCAVCD